MIFNKIESEELFLELENAENQILGSNPKIIPQISEAKSHSAEETRLYLSQIKDDKDLNILTWYLRMILDDEI